MSRARPGIRARRGPLPTGSSPDRGGGSGTPVLPRLRVGEAQEQRTREEQEALDLGQPTTGRSASRPSSPASGRRTTRAVAVAPSRPRTGSATWVSARSCSSREPATVVQNRYRAHAAREGFLEQRGAAVAQQASARGWMVRDRQNARRRYLAAVAIQKWTRGFVDRQWATMLALM